MTSVYRAEGVGFLWVLQFTPCSVCVCDWERMRSYNLNDGERIYKFVGWGKMLYKHLFYFILFCSKGEKLILLLNFFFTSLILQNLSFGSGQALKQLSLQYNHVCAHSWESHRKHL